MDIKDEINQRLLERYGLYPDGKPRYRVVKSDEEIELRRGKFAEYYGETLIREYEGVEPCRKYSYLDGHWVLEIRIPTFNEELTEPITYEPLFVLQDKDGKALPMNYDAVIAAINLVENRQKQEPWTQKREDYESAEQLKKETRIIRAKIDERSTDNMDWKWMDKEAVFVPDLGGKIFLTDQQPEAEVNGQGDNRIILP